MKLSLAVFGLLAANVSVSFATDLFLRGGDESEVNNAERSLQSVGLCDDQLPFLDAETCNVSCTSNDLEVDGAFLETDGCVTCSCGEDVTARLKLKIRNKTGSTRTAFGYTATLIAENESCPASGPTPVSCVDERCNDTEGIPQTIDDLVNFPEGSKVLDFGEVTFKCGDQLRLTNILQYWTDASPKSTCDSFARCRDLSPKCGRPIGDIIITPPLFVTADSQCQVGSSEVIVTATVIGGVPEYSFLWSNGESGEVIGPVPDAAYTVTVTDSDPNGGCTASASVPKQDCCFFEATCKALENLVGTGCTVADIPLGIGSTTDSAAINDIFNVLTTSPCGVLTMTTSDSETTVSCPFSAGLTRTYTLADAAGNSLSCTQDFDVQKITAPTINPIGDVEQECAAGCAANGPEACFGTPTVSDVCGDVITPVSSGIVTEVDGCGATGTFSQTWTAQDSCGLVATPIKQTVTIVDTTDPTFDGDLTATNSFMVSCDAAIPMAPTLTASDTCGTASVAASCCLSATGIDRSWVATDECGRSTSIDQNIAITCSA